MSSLPAWPMISSEVAMWLSRISRWMSANPKASNPWTIEVKHDLHHGIFEVLRKSVQRAPSAFGVSVEDKVGKCRHKNRLLCDFSNFLASLGVKLQRNLRRALEGTIKVLKLRCL